MHRNYKHEEKEKENHHINGWKKIHSHIITFREIEKFRGVAGISNPKH